MGKGAAILVKILGDSSGLGSALNDADSKLAAFSQKTVNVGKSMMKAGGLMTAGLTLPMLAIGKGAVDAFVEADQANAQMEASLKSTGATAWTSSGQMDTLAQSMQDILAIDGDLVKSGQSVLLTFTNVQNKIGEGNDVFDRATFLGADMAAKLGTDLPAANVLLGKSLNEPIAGMGALRKAGVQLTEADQERVRAMVESGDVLGAQKILLKELETQFGGSAAAAAASASPMERLKLKLEDMQESIGERLIPVLVKMGDVLQVGFDIWDKLGSKGQTIVLVLAGVLTVIGPVVTLFGALTTVVGLVTGTVAAMGAAFTAAGAGMAGVGAALGVIFSPVVLVVGAIGLLVGAFVLLYKNVEPFRAWIDNIASIVKDKLLYAFDELKGGIRAFAATWTANDGDVTSSGFPGFMEHVANGLRVAQVAMQEIADRVIPALGTAFGWITDTALPSLVEAWDWLMIKLDPVIDALGELLPVIFHRVVDSMHMTITVVGFLVRAFVEGMNVIWPVVEWVWGMIVTQIEAAINFIAAIIRTVTAVLSGDWAAAWQGIKDAAAAIWDGIVGLVGGALGKLWEIAKSVGPMIGGAIADVWNGINNKAREAIDAVIGHFLAMPGRILNTIARVAGAAGDVGSSIMEGIGKGLSGAVGFVSDIAGKIWDNIKDAVNGGLDTVRRFGVTVFGADLRPFSALPRLARGVTSAAAGMYTVGDRGPENVYLPAGARVTPAHQSSGDGGGFTIIAQTNARAIDIARETEWILKEG